jgi:hypothetical protein
VVAVGGGNPSCLANLPGEQKVPYPLIATILRIAPFGITETKLIRVAVLIVLFNIVVGLLEKLRVMMQLGAGSRSVLRRNRIEPTAPISNRWERFVVYRFAGRFVFRFFPSARSICFSSDSISRF